MKYNVHKKQELVRKDVLDELFNFINQLLLLLGSGMVLQEALTTIGQNYEDKGTNGNTFIDEYCRIYRESQNNGKSMIYMLNILNKQVHTKELSKVISIISDGNKKGIDLWDKLFEQREAIWDERKRLGIERIRMMESKMSFPLALLLIALLLITAAPAMMQM